MFIFTDFVDDPEARYLMGYSLIFFSLANLAINLAVLLFVSVSNLVNKFKHFKKKI